MKRFLNDLQNKLQRFMWGRYGADEFTRFLLAISMALLLLACFPKLNKVYLLAEAVLIYSVYRSLSKNLAPRRQELNWYLGIKRKVVSRFNVYKRMWTDRKTHRYFRCKQCGTYVRVPKGMGNIMVTCPKCRTESQQHT